MKTDNLPYVKTETFTLNGQPYKSEPDALRAAIEAALGNAGVSASVLRECCVLAPLLARACELGLGNKPAAGAQ